MSDLPSEVPAEDVLNILVASDIHLGYADRDPLRGEDSYTTFEEILSLANERDVDLILLGGDLFHESKPMPKCTQRCMSLIRKYCMGDRSVAVEFLSDQAENFRHCEHPVVNYEDPNLNVSIPIFSIHGNHDDPSGYGRISSLDLLSTSGLVNYFGKWMDLTHVDISPLLMRKGNTRLALYGLSYLKDERLARLFNDSCVKWFRPREDQDEWCNIFVLHQNRVNHGVKTYIPEEMLPNFLDLVIWGHEHECRIVPEFNDNKRFYVCQPGSPVATSLCEAESVKKHVAILSIYKKKFKVTPIPLKTVRPFVMDSIVLADGLLNLSRENPAEEVQEYISEHLETLMERAAEQITGDSRQPKVPLIRLRVEYADDKQAFNAIRFGMKYGDKVANPSDLLLFRKQRLTDKMADENSKDAHYNLEDRQGISMERVEKIVEKYFTDVAPHKYLQVLSAKGLSEAMTRYVDKDDKEAMYCIIDHQIKKTEDRLIGMDVAENDIDKEIENFRQERLARAEEDMKEACNVLDRPSRQYVGQKQEIDSDLDDNTEVDIDVDAGMDIYTDVPVAATSRGGRGRGRVAARTATGARGGRRSRGRGRGEPALQTSIKDAFGKPSPRAASSRSRHVVIYVDSDD